MKGSILLCWLRQICCLSMQPDTSDDKIFCQCSSSLFKIRAVTLYLALTNTCAPVCKSPWWSRNGLLLAMGQLPTRRSDFLKACACGCIHRVTIQTYPLGLSKLPEKSKSASSRSPRAPGQFFLSRVAPYTKVTQMLRSNPYPVLKIGLPEFQKLGAGGRVIIFLNGKTIRKWSHLWDPTGVYWDSCCFWNVEWAGDGVAKVADNTKLFRVLKPEADFGDLQNYFMVLSHRAISKKADKQ